MRNVLEYLEKSAALYPNKLAVEDEYWQCSFSALAERCRRVGSALAEKIDSGSPVAVLMDKGIQTLISFMGIVYAGGFYALLNPELPKARLEQIQAVLQAQCIVTDQNNISVAREIFPDTSIFSIEELQKFPIAEERLNAIRSEAIDTDPLYANFTSGSTGVPKGVVVSHRSVIDFIDTFTSLFGIDESDIIGNQAPFDFDVSVKDIFSALKTGAALSIIPRRLFSRPKELLDWICERRVTTMTWAVSALCLISTLHGLDYRVPVAVRRVLFSGEIMPEKHRKIWMEKLPDAQFINLYGPTEITCNCTYHVLDRARDYAQGIPIGRAFPNEQVFLLDGEDKRIVGSGATGEICVRGTALALGYYRSPEQTVNAFVQNPLNSSYPELIYRTGDLGKYNEEGEIVFCGRKDFQIKYMGHRIELEEIERAISALEGVERCCCVFDEYRQKLFGFYIGSLDKKDLHSKLRSLLPVFMVPGSLCSLSEFPLNKNGKVDRKQLLERGKQK